MPALSRLGPGVCVGWQLAVGFRNEVKTAYTGAPRSEGDSWLVLMGVDTRGIPSWVYSTPKPQSYQRVSQTRLTPARGRPSSLSLSAADMSFGPLSLQLQTGSHQCRRLTQPVLMPPKCVCLPGSPWALLSSDRPQAARIACAVCSRWDRCAPRF